MNAEQYLSEVFRIIQESFRSNDSTGGMPVASAAYLVKRTLKVEQTAFGFPKFKDVLEELESRGLVKTGVNSKSAYSLWLVDQEHSGAPRLSTAVSFRPLRKEIWFAFVAEQPGCRFFNRLTGEVRIGLDEPPSGDDWIEIFPLDPSRERERAAEFLQEYKIDDPQIVASLSHERWFVEFPKALSAQHPGLAADWKRHRSRRVINHVINWCGENSVNEALVFQATSIRPTLKTISPKVRTGDDVRSVLLGVINKLPTHELLQLRLPAHELLAALRPELLN